MVQNPTDDPESLLRLIGREYQLCDAFESRIKKEFEALNPLSHNTGSISIISKIWTSVHIQ